MTCSTSYCLYNTLMDPWNVCMYMYIYICVCVRVYIYIYIHTYTYTYTGCNRRKGPDFGRVFLMLNYTEKPQNTYIQS